MGVLKHDWLASEQNYPALSKSDTYTITVEDVLQNDVFVQTGTTKVFTLPPAAKSMTGQVVTVCALTAGTVTTKVFVLAGFGGAGASYDTVSMIGGQFAQFLCDGTYWYSLNATVPAGS